MLVLISLLVQELQRNEVEHEGIFTSNITGDVDVEFNLFWTFGGFIVWTLDTLEPGEIVDDVSSKEREVCSSKGWINVESDFDEVEG